MGCRRRCVFVCACVRMLECWFGGFGPVHPQLSTKPFQQQTTTQAHPAGRIPAEEDQEAENKRHTRLLTEGQAFYKVGRQFWRTSDDGPPSIISFHINHTYPTTPENKQLGRGGRKHARFVWLSPDLSTVLWRKAGRPFASSEGGDGYVACVCVYICVCGCDDSEGF